MSTFPCPYLKGAVELTTDRERHIAERHPDLLPEHQERIAELPWPIRSQKRPVRRAKLFSRYADVRLGNTSWSS